jgi:hypothetical protein
MFKLILFACKVRLSQKVNKAVGRTSEELGFYTPRVGVVSFITAYKPDLRPKQIPLGWIPVALSLASSLSEGEAAKV